MDKVHTKAKDSTPGQTPQAVLGPLSLRDLIVVIGGVAVIVGSLVPIPWTERVSVNMWIFPGLPFHFFVSLLLPLLVAGGFAWRRLTGRTRVRVGSLSLDQAGSVISLFAAAYFFNSYVASMSPAYLIGFIGALAMVAGTTLAAYLGAFRRDFAPGGESVLGSDVAPMPAPANKQAVDAQPAARPTDSSADERFGASSAVPGSGRTTNRPGVPHSGKNEAQPAPAAEVSPSAPSPSSSLATGSAASATASPAPATSSSAAPTAAAAASEDSAEVRTPAAKEAVAGPSTAFSAATKNAPGTTDEGDIEEATPQKSAATSLVEANQQPANDATSTAASSTPAANPGTFTATDTPDTNESSPATTANSTDTPPAAGADAGKNDAPPPATGVKTVPTGPDAKFAAAQSGTPKADAAEATAEPASGSLGRDPESAPKAAEPAPASDTDSTQVPEAVSLAAEEHRVPGTQQPAWPRATAAPEAPSAPVDQATSAVPHVTGDIKATAALSRVEIDEHRAAAERAKAEAESSFGARAEHAAADPVPASFWFALNHSRPVFHPAKGTMLATLQPGTWFLCLEDRGNEYLINMADGRPAVLRNLDDLQFPDK